jgi:predicted flavoprotein YhiN
MHTETTDVLILGGGAAGLMCAIEAGKRGLRVVVVEHAERVGKKILISGGGRCNFTNTGASPRNFLSNNPDFCRSALARYTAQDFIALVESHGIAYHEKKLGQLFCDHSSREIVQMLERECEQAGVRILTNHALAGGVSAIAHKREHKREHEREHEREDKSEYEVVHGASHDASHGASHDASHGAFTTTITNKSQPHTPVVIRSATLVVATGGPAIPKMGATDIGYAIARKFGLAIISPKPALVPFTADQNNPALCLRLRLRLRLLAALRLPSARICCSRIAA